LVFRLFVGGGGGTNEERRAKSASAGVRELLFQECVFHPRLVAFKAFAIFALSLSVEFFRIAERLNDGRLIGVAGGAAVARRVTLSSAETQPDHRPPPAPPPLTQLK
jgi:hypothetical protein